MVDFKLNKRVKEVIFLKMDNAYNVILHVIIALAELNVRIANFSTPNIDIVAIIHVQKEHMNKYSIPFHIEGLNGV